MKLRDLRINQSVFYYQEYLGQEDLLDEDGNKTGETIPKYSNPVRALARISPTGVKAGSSMTSSEAYSGSFGIDIDYDRAISTVQNLPIDEYSRLFIDVVPVINDDGSTDTEPDYYCVRPAHDLEQNVWGIKKNKAAAGNEQDH